ncbi:eCIS core domain-containing protein [Kitasatospora azatica]|uniref:eCIS core domain-containing protein n=1 Tax=Kitasatospora azatica TaxID=58347 RepID=UPI000689DE83|nr:DUF4157 domain-containing protein [Kitasatospora azatica]
MEVEQTTAAAREQRTVRRRSQQSGRAAAPGPLVGSVEWIAASGAGNRAVAALLHPTRVTGEPAAGEGRPLDQAVRAEMEAHLGADFSRVRVHTGPAAEAAASALDARAYTVGQDIVFGPGEYRPSEPVGRAVLAHELTHAAQQARGGTTAAGSPGAERAARAGAASLTAGQRPAPVAVGAAVGVARQGKTEEVPGQAPAEERFGTLGEAALDLATAPLGSGLAQRAMKAAVRGFVGQLRREAASGEAAARIQADLAELRKPGNLGPMLGGAAAGLALGLVSPVTDLFSLAALVERLPELGSRLGYWLGAKAKWLADEATSLGHEVSGFAGQLWAAVKKLKEDRTAVFELLESKGTELSARLEAAAGQSGREAAAKIVGFFTGKKEGPEKKEEEKPAESVWHVLTTTVEGETSGVASFLASKAGRLVDTGFTGRWSRFGRDLGKALGVVVSNLLILALTDGAGNAIIAIADKLGRLGGLAAGGARALAGFGQAVRVVEGAIAAVIAGGIKLAKPLEAVAGPLGRLLERFRLFLRRLLGVVEHEGAAAAAGAGKAAGDWRTRRLGGHPGRSLRLRRPRRPQLRWPRPRPHRRCRSSRGCGGRLLRS